jgi:hypothetical protein
VAWLVVDMVELIQVLIPQQPFLLLLLIDI